MNLPNRRTLWVVLTVALALAVVIVATAILVAAYKSTQIRDDQVTNTRTINSSQRVLKIIRDCTKPEGKCYKRAQRQTASAVANINRVVIIAAACASRPAAQTVEQIQECVIERLSADQDR